MTRTHIALVVLLAAPAAGADPAARASLEGGGFAALRGDATEDLEAARLARAAAFELRQRLAAGGTGAVDAASPALPKALGDRLVISMDDGVAPVAAAWEARLDVSGGAAGGNDAMAVRFPAQALASSPSFDVSSVIVGLDDRHGVASWPVELWLEDAAAPMQPRRGTATVAGILDAAAAGLVPTTGARPTDFRRVAVPLRLNVPDAWLGDGAFDDDFGRSDGPLAIASSDWFECEDGNCGRLPLDVDIVSGAAVRSTGGGALLVVKFPEFGRETLRPHRDLDVTASVRILDGAAGFSRAGLALRVMAADAYYRVEYQQTPPQVVVSAVLPSPLGVVPVGAPLAVLTPSAGSRQLEVRVTGATPNVRFEISVDGSPLGTVSDAQWRLTGWYAGLSASDPASSGEAWDDFRVERRPDVFAVVGHPAGADAGLPLDVSSSSLVSQSVLVSSDGTAFEPVPAGAGCPNPGNPFVQLEVEDAVSGDRLFQREAKVVSVNVSCPTCLVGVSRCSSNLALAERSAPVLTTGETATARVRWWNEHRAADSLIFQGSLWTGPCDLLGAPVAAGAVTGVGSAGQGSPATAEVDVFSFTPVDPGPHCLVIEELHDTNGDCCPDGAETTPLGTCGGTCTLAPPSDSNPGTSVTLVDLEVFAPCASPLGEDVGRDGPDDLTGDGLLDEINLDGASLRVAKGAGDDVVLSWSVIDSLVFPSRYNIHSLRAGRFDRSACYPEQAPPVRLVLGRTDDTFPVSAPLGESSWLAVFETNGCGGEASVPDGSLDDPALGCP